MRVFQHNSQHDRLVSIKVFCLYKHILYVVCCLNICYYYFYIQYIDEVINRPQLQGLFLKLLSSISLLLGLAYKLNSPSLGPVGLEFPSTLSYSLCWCFMFTDALISLRFKLSALQGGGGGYEHMLDIISRAHIPMMVFAFVCFSVAPVTFLFPNALKFSLADAVFGVEAHNKHMS